MKTKLACLAFILISSSGCMTTTNTYTRDIVYRDGSYYSPADEQYGDYYYEPEPDYSYYDNYNYGFDYYDSSYRSYSSSRCRFSYRYDRYCDRGWGNSYLHFGGLSLFFGNSNHYGYGYGNYGGYPYYGWHSPRPRHRDNDPTPTPKPRPRNPVNPNIPEYGFENRPGVRVPGEPVLRPVKPGAIDQNPAEPYVEQQDRPSLNPYTRRGRPNPRVRPENWQYSGNDGNNEVQGIPSEKPTRDNRRPRPSPRAVGNADSRQQAPAVDSSDSAPAESNRVERTPPRSESRQSPRIERPVRSERRASSDDKNREN